MQITRITEVNEEFFQPFLPDAADYERPELLRLGAVTDDNEVAGALAAVIDFEVIEIMSIYVLPEYRRQGYGRELVNTVISLAEQAEGSYSAISASFAEDLTVRAFWAALGFDIFGDMSMYQIRFGEIMRSEKCRKILLKGDTKGVRQISSLDDTEKRILDNYLTERSMPVTGYYDPDWSTVVFTEGEISSAMLIKPSMGRINVLWFGMDSKDIKEPLKHMATYIRKIEADPSYDGTTPIVFPADNDSLLDVVETFTGSKSHITMTESYSQAIKLTGRKENTDV